MSHDEHHDSSPGQPTPAPPAEYGVSLPRPQAPYSHSTRELPTKGAAPPAVEVVDETMQDPDQLTHGERWAVNASNSQFNALAGAVGGFTSGIVTCPLDVIKTKLQAQGGFTTVQKGRHVGHTKIYEGLIGTARVIWRQEGIRGMYRGLGPIILGYLPTWAVWFTVYNKSKIWVGQYQSRFRLLLRRGVTRGVYAWILTFCFDSKFLCDQLLVVYYRWS
jgi:solute carrier family 25 (mitochondrial folate transporter), member 32